MKSQLISKPIRKRIPILILTTALATSVITVYSVFRFQSATKNSSPSAANTNSSVDSIAALGYLEPQGEVIYLSAPASVENARVGQLLVKLGDRVKVGQTIAILDSRERLQAALQIAQQQVAVAQARLAQVKAGAKQGEILAQDANFQQTKAELIGQIQTQKAAIAHLKAELDGEHNTQAATIAKLKAELGNAHTDCQRYQALYRSGAVAEQSRDSFCLKAETNQQLLQEAQANLKRIVTSRGEQIREAQANLQRTIATQHKQIEQAQATLDATAEVRLVDIQVASAELQQARADVQKAKADLASAYVQAPKSGRVLKIHTWAGEIVGTQGIIELGRIAQMYVRAEVYETDITRVRVGQRATIKGDRGIGDLQGTVDEIGLQIGKKNVLGNDPIAETDARVVEVKIRLDLEDSKRVASLTNMQVHVVINPNPLKQEGKQNI
jgi:HlyD family secretion protein